MMTFSKQKPEIERIPQTNPIKTIDPEIIPDPGKTEPNPPIPEIEPLSLPEIEPIIMPEVDPEPLPGFEPDIEE